jgi:hypothetical protein
MMDEMTAQMRSAMMRNMPEMDAGAVHLMDDWLEQWIANSKVILREHIPAIVDAQAEGCARMFDAAELRDILAFVSTPSGQRFMDAAMARMLCNPGVVVTPSERRGNRGCSYSMKSGLIVSVL